jgi:hypothetical protein
MAWF